MHACCGCPDNLHTAWEHPGTPYASACKQLREVRARKLAADTKTLIPPPSFCCAEGFSEIVVGIAGVEGTRAPPWHRSTCFALPTTRALIWPT